MATCYLFALNVYFFHTKHPATASRPHGFGRATLRRERRTANAVVKPHSARFGEAWAGMSQRSVQKANMTIAEGVHLKNILLAFTVLAYILYIPGVYALDANGLDEAALYAITTDVDGETLAWTLVVPADRPRELVGTNPDIDRVELRPYKPGHNRQLWQIYPEDVVPAPSYKVFCKFGSNNDEPNAPVMISRVNGDFAPEDDVEFHARYNAMAIGPNQASIEKFFLITRQANGGFVAQTSSCGRSRWVQSTKPSAAKM
jgi:hypothetical protein